MATQAHRHCLRLLPVGSGQARSSVLTTSTIKSSSSSSFSSSIPAVSSSFFRTYITLHENGSNNAYTPAVRRRRPTFPCNYSSHSRLSRQSQPRRRAYATSLNTTGTTTTRRRRVTALNDDGRVPWGQLTAAEKVARTTQQTVNMSVVAIGALATAAVAYLMWDQVFSTDSKVTHFNRAFDELRAHPAVLELLGPAGSLTAHGEGSWSKWSRNRTIASTLTQDGAGRDHLMMHFYVEGPKNRATVRLHMVRPEVGAPFAYRTFDVDVPGHATIHVRKDRGGSGDPKKGFNFLGINWGTGSKT